MQACSWNFSGLTLQGAMLQMAWERTGQEKKHLHQQETWNASAQQVCWSMPQENNGLGLCSTERNLESLFSATSVIVLGTWKQ